MLGEMQKTANMANLSRVTPIRIEKRTVQCISIPDYSSVSSLEEDYGSTESEGMSTSPDTSCRSSADADRSFDLDEDFRKKLPKFDDIIEKMKNLRFERDDGNDEKNANENIGGTRRISSEKVDNVEYWNTCKSQMIKHTDSEDINNNEDNVTTDEGCLPFNIHNEFDDKEGQCRSLDDQNSTDDGDSEGDQERQDHEDSDNSDLIERGPIKPDYQSIREHPYSMVSWLSRVNDSADVLHAVDYDKTAEQILRNKDYSEKLNPCLDQLSNSSRNQSEIDAIGDGLTIVPGWTGESAEDVFRHGELSSDTAALPSIVVNDPGEEFLMDIISRGGFQAAVLPDAGSHSIPSPGAKTWSDSPASSYNNVVSRSNSRASSRAQSPGSATNLESPQMHVNVIGSPLGSPQVASTYRVPQALSSSSSSNQSYSDASSPLNYQTPLHYQIEEQLDESLACWKGTYDSSGTIVNSNDNIDWLVELIEVIEENKGALKEPQIASNAPCLTPIYNDQCVSETVSTLENNLNGSSCPDMRSEKPETCLSTTNANPIVDNLPIDDGLMSVYTTKENSSGCTFVNRSINGLQRYYESSVKSAQANVSQQDTLHNIALENEGSPSSTFVRDYQIPTTVCSSASSRPRRNSNRGIVPWPSLNLPSIRASERLKEGLHPKEVERAMSNLLKKSVEELAAADEDGDTALMCLVGNPEELATKKAYLAPLVERLGNVPGALSMVNNRGEDALYLAAMNCPEMPYVVGYLAAAMLQKGIDINQRLYHIRGDTLIHSVAARGDSYGEVLAELLALKTLQGNTVFDLSKRNYYGRTALHIAVESHDPIGRGVKSLATTRLLLENGADLKVKESKCGDTALHMAASLNCDPALVKVLLSKASSSIVNETNYMYNTPLHMAAVSNSVDLEKQKEVCRLLIQAGGQTNIQNRQGKTPLALVSSERKDVIKRIFYKKS
nr:PREDICTED: uncharacterized protein LOC105676443 [Linepithema humile]